MDEDDFDELEELEELEDVKLEDLKAPNSLEYAAERLVNEALTLDEEGEHGASSNSLRSTLVDMYLRSADMYMECIKSMDQNNDRGKISEIKRKIEVRRQGGCTHGLWVMHCAFFLLL